MNDSSSEIDMCTMNMTVWQNPNNISNMYHQSVITDITANLTIQAAIEAYEFGNTRSPSSPSNTRRRRQIQRTKSVIYPAIRRNRNATAERSHHDRQTGGQPISGGYRY